MAKLKNTGMIRVGNAVVKERNPAWVSCKNAHCFLLAEKGFLISNKKQGKCFKIQGTCFKI